ncbi:MAG: hydrogenase maturation protease [Candidatus Acidiferrales bacterium]
MIRTLVIACGNPLRADDGVAWRVAEALEDAVDDADVRIRTVRQLTPELAEDVSRAETVFFVDAAASENPGSVKVEPLREMPAMSACLTHSVRPATLLWLARKICGKAPARAFLVTIAGSRFDLSEDLSEPAALAVSEAVRRIQSA